MSDDVKSDMSGTNKDILNALLLQYTELTDTVKRNMSFAEFCNFVIQKEQLKRIDSCDY